MMSSRAISFTLSINPSFWAILVRTPGGRLMSTLSMISFVIVALAKACTRVLASLSRSVLLPPLCLILICKFWLPSEPKNLPQPSYGQMNVRSIS